jgi:hypothetical protein
MTAEVFIRRWLGLFALLSGLVIFSPFLIQAVLANSGCSAISGRCDILAGALDHYCGALMLALILIPLLVAIAGRSLAVGMFAFAFPFLLLVTAGALPLLQSLGHVARPGFLEETGMMQGATQLLFLLVGLVCLSVAGDDQEGASGAWKAVLGFVMLSAGFVTAPSWLAGFALLPYASHLVPPLALFIGRAHAALGITDLLPMLQTQILVAMTLGTAGLMFSRARTDAPARKRSWA